VTQISEQHLREHQLEVRKYFWRNYLAHSIEGGLFGGGMTFLEPATVLPVMIAALNGPTWLIAVVPVLMGIGFQLPPLLVAHWIEKLHWVKGLVWFLGFLQRAPYLLVGLVLIFWGRTHPYLALAAAAACPLISGLIGGVGGSAWQELVAKTVPENRRSSMWAIRFTIRAGIGLLAGVVIAKVLSHFSATTGYGILHLITLGFLMMSWIVFGLIRETHLPARAEEKTNTLGNNLKAMPSLVSRDVRLRRFLLARILMCGIFIMVPFLAIHTLRTTGRPDSFVGLLVVFQMVGWVAGNLLAGVLGDRIGGKIVLLFSSFITVAICLWAVTASNVWEFLGIFFLLGLDQSCMRIGQMTLGLEICPMKKRATYVAIIAAIAAPAMPIAALIGAQTWKWTNESFTPVAFLAAGLMLLAGFFQWRIDEPRKEPLLLEPPLGQ
jgi:MFS family permease